MGIIKIEGVKAYKDIHGKISIIVDSDYIDECMNIYSRNNLDGVVINTLYGYNLQDINFLIDYPDIENLSISDGIGDISAVHRMYKLKYLYISGKNRKIDFSNFPVLKRLIVEWSPLLSNMDKCTCLEDLILRGYKAKDCLELPKVVSVKGLTLIQSTIFNLNGLEKFNQLEKLEFNYCSKLENLCCLESSNESLTYLFFDHCKSIKNHDYVTKLTHLYTLAYNDCGVIPSIKFIKKMPSLKDIRFGGTDITDGDMTPCVGFKYAAFTNKKHFSHTMEQIKSLSNT